MAGIKSFSRREKRKAPADIAVVPDLGVRLTMPRRTNRAAARAVASGDVFWDKRKVASKDPHTRVGHVQLMPDAYADQERDYR